MSSASARPRILFVTGRLAEPALRRVVDSIAPEAGFEPLYAVLPISVAALMTPGWVARHLEPPPALDRVILPGFCQGDLSVLLARAGGVPCEVGPRDLRDLPRFFGQTRNDPPALDAHALEILAEINHAPRLERGALIDQANHFRAQGADVIDLGMIPGLPWDGVGDAVAALRDQGHRISIDSFEAREVEAAVKRGAELVLSVNATNRERAADWGVEVVAIPDQSGTLDGLDETVGYLLQRAVPLRIDPILEPIGFGFANSLQRYHAVRTRYPGSALLMGVGNLTELTDVDSAGVNVLLAGYCRELNIGSVLTTAVINWARSAVRELDLARRLVHHAVTHQTLPKHLEPRLVMLRDTAVPRFGPEQLAELQRRIKDPNWRLFAEDGLLYALNSAGLLADADPFALFDRMDVRDAAHAFYLGYELAKARTALTLGKAYRQDESLDWGFLTEPEESHLERRRRAARGDRSSEDVS